LTPKTPYRKNGFFSKTFSTFRAFFLPSSQNLKLRAKSLKTQIFNEFFPAFKVIHREVCYDGGTIFV
jgi:hypothetical protein